MKKNIAVIFGGMSSEAEISKISAAFILKNLDEKKYQVYPIFINLQGEWFLLDEGKTTQEVEALKTRVEISAGRYKPGIKLFSHDFSKVTKIIPLDCIFPVLHGSYGEDGTIQGLFELAGIPYVGCGVLASALAMDKVYMRMLFAYAGIPQVTWTYCKRQNFLKEQAETIAKIEKQIAYPIFVKPANAGSSFGISKAENKEALLQAIEFALQYDDKVLFEETVIGHEIETAALGGADHIISACGEVIAAKDWYDFEAKYQDENSKTIIPANLSQEKSDEIRKYAGQAYNLIEGQGLARIDFFVRAVDEQVFLNEINTMPGFTSISMYPKLFEAQGIKSQELLDQLIQFGITYHQEKIKK